MPDVKALMRALDRLQQRWPVLGFPLAVLRKSTDDQAGMFSALVSYYAFFAIFPLLLVLVSVLDIVLANNPKLRQEIIDSAFGQFPVIGTQLQDRGFGSTGVAGQGLALLIGVVGTFLGARGMASAISRACDGVWAVPWLERRRGWRGQADKLLLIVVVGGGLVASSVLAGFVAARVDLPVSGTTGGLFLTGVLNVAVFLASFRLGTSPSVPTRWLLLAAALAALGWTVLQSIGVLYMTRQVANYSDVYGVFAIVIGLLAWLYLSAYVTLLALEVSAVRRLGLSPRSFFARTELTEADRRAFTVYAEGQQRSEEQHIDVTYDEAEGSEGLEASTETR